MIGMSASATRVNVNNAMNKPTWTSYFLRIGGISAVFAIVILTAKEFFPGAEGYVVMGVAFFLLLIFVGIDVRADKGKRKNDR